MRSSAVPPGKLTDEGETQCCLKTHGEKDKLLQCHYYTVVHESL